MTLPGLPQPHITKIDCGSCRACCKNTMVAMVDGDDPSLAWITGPGGLPVLDQKPNGDCVYLGDRGCTIHGRHPAMCRMFDCAGFVKRMDEGAFEGIGAPLGSDVIREGRKRLNRTRRAG
jgi:Fe-S-cluster containining protein